MNIESKEIENTKPDYDDSEEIVTIDYYDRINKKWIKLDVTKKVARFLAASDKKMQRKQNQYDFYNKQFDIIFNENKPQNEHFLIDEENDPEYVLEKQEKEMLEYVRDEHNRTLIENSLFVLTPTQKEVVEMAFYQNMSYSQIAERLGIDKSSVYARMKKAEKNIKKYIEDTEK